MRLYVILESLEMRFSLFSQSLFSIPIDLCAHLDIQVCRTTTFLSTLSIQTTTLENRE